MNENSKEQNTKATQYEIAETTSSTNATSEVIIPTNSTENAPKKKSKKKLKIIGSIAGVVVIVAVVIAIVLMPSKLQKVKSECVKMAGGVTSSSNNDFTIDTSLFGDATHIEKALKAVKYANEELGFPSYVYSNILETTALMGRQTKENDDYTVSWTYDPDEGLKVTYSEK